MDIVNTYAGKEGGGKKASREQRAGIKKRAESSKQGAGKRPAAEVLMAVSLCLF